MLSLIVICCIIASGSAESAFDFSNRRQKRVYQSIILQLRKNAFFGKRQERQDRNQFSRLGKILLSVARGLCTAWQIHFPANMDLGLQWHYENVKKCLTRSIAIKLFQIVFQTCSIFVFTVGLQPV